jgi:hypothetical protein
MINAMSGLHTSPQTSSILTAVDATIVLTYVMNVLLIASQKGSACWPNTQYAWDKCRNGTVKVYESVQDAVGVHQTSGGRTKVRARSSASCAMLHREPDNAKKMNRGGCLPHTTHVSASDEEAGMDIRANTRPLETTPFAGCLTPKLRSCELNVKVSNTWYGIHHGTRSGGYGEPWVWGMFSAVCRVRFGNLKKKYIGI